MNLDVKTYHVKCGSHIQAVKAKRNVWLMFLQAIRQQEMLVQQTFLEVKKNQGRYCCYHFKITCNKKSGGIVCTG